MNYELFRVRLNLFGDGAAGAEGASGETTASSVPTRQSKSGDDHIIYGKQVDVTTNTVEQPSDAGNETPETHTTSNTLEERKKAWRDLVNGEYKDLYTEDTQKLINKRFKEEKAVRDSLSKQQPIIELLSQRYNVTDGDMGKLMSALEGDTAFWQQVADESGMSMEQYMKMQRLQRENRALQEQQRQRDGAAAAQRQIAAWTQEAQALKAKYPGFDLNAEAQNEQFVRMLRTGVPMEHAYRVMHMDEIVNDSVRTMAQQTEQRVVNNVRARGARPAENGTSSQGAFTYKDDVSKLSKKDRASIAKRVARGETIRF